MKDRCLLWLPFWRLCLHGLVRGVQCWSPIQISKISSVEPKTSPVIWSVIYLSLERIPKLKRLLFGNMNYLEAAIPPSYYVSNLFWAFKLKQNSEYGRVMHFLLFSPLKNHPKRKRKTKEKQEIENYRLYLW